MLALEIRQTKDFSFFPPNKVCACVRACVCDHIHTPTSQIQKQSSPLLAACIEFKKVENTSLHGAEE